ncbi:efflux RND transporter periplasmic adaptor subunit [Zooshikella sp. RANM57]|uniref:efflux RND transporter periplasmic adaptor subunit n=1 Tax=Zooshikella sp. RANM57 TaxID=3425863 RepID=UPI003D6E1AC9
MDENKTYDNMMKRFVVFSLLVGLTVGVIAVLKWTAKTPERREQLAVITQVEVQQVQKQALSPVIELYGVLESPYEVELTAPVTAFVKTTQVREGDSVNQGDILVQLDDRDLQLLLKQRLAEIADIEARIEAEKQRYQADQQRLKDEQVLLAIAERGVTRQQSLRGRNAASETQLDEARRQFSQQALNVTNIQYQIEDHPHRLSQLNAQLQRAKALHMQVELDIERSIIRSPYPAKIVSLHTAPGARVLTGEPLITLYDAETIEVRAQIPSRYLPEIQQAMDQKYAITGELALDNQLLPVTLMRLAHAVRQGRGGLDAFFNIEGTSLKLAIGRPIQLTIHLPPQHGVTALPPQAIYNDDMVYRVKDGRLQGVSVKLLGRNNSVEGKSRVLIRSDALHIGDDVMITHLPDAISGLHVRVVKRD